MGRGRKRLLASQVKKLIEVYFQLSTKIKCESFIDKWK